MSRSPDNIPDISSHKGGSSLNYTDNEKKEHIRELQQYLRAISFYNNRIPQVLPNGVFDAETKNAVAEFQREYKLPITGSADENTWNEIFREYMTALEYNTRPMGIYAFPDDGSILSVGSTGAAVVMLQAMLAELSASFANIRHGSITGKFDENNERSVKFMQTVMGMTPSGKVDIIMWNRIVELFDNQLHES